HTKTYYAHVMIALIEVNEAVSKASIMSKQERQEFWTAMTKTAEKDSDKLKASELLGRSCADFIDKREIIFPGIGAIDLTTLILKVTEKNEQQPG
ncbi:MAG: hypothetical protein U1C57_01910, partial [Candidatus Doudnabacteria bacterium]|nr:hypothetical protein [Candidatus Doudnabacteria bacterium]